MPEKVNYQVYRHFDKEGMLLYIGCTQNLFARTMQHEQKANWFKQIRSITIEHFKDKDVAFNAEAMYILAENPPYNRRDYKYRDREEEKKLRIKKANLWLTSEWQSFPYGEISESALKSLEKVGFCISRQDPNSSHRQYKRED